MQFNDFVNAYLKNFRIENRSHKRDCIETASHFGFAKRRGTFWAYQYLYCFTINGDSIVYFDCTLLPEAWPENTLKR